MTRLTLVLIFILGACTGGTDGDPLFTEELAGEFLKANTTPERSLRTCLAVGVVAEVWTYRLIYRGGTPQEKALARAAIEEMLVTLAKLREAGAQAVWFETEMFYAGVALVQGLEPALTQRVISGVQIAATGSIAGILDLIRTAGGQAALGTAMIRDIQHYFQEEIAGQPDAVAAGWGVCEDRLRVNLGRLS